MKKLYILITLLLALQCFATARYVDVTKLNDTGDGLTPGAAKKTISAALADIPSPAGGDIVWIKNSGTYTLSAGLTNPANNVCIVGYDTVISDEDDWTSSDLNDSTHLGTTPPGRTRVTIDCDSGAFAGITSVDWSELYIANLKFTNVDSAQDPITFTGSTWGDFSGVIFFNCEFTGGNRIDMSLSLGSIIQESYHTGDWTAVDAKTATGGVYFGMQLAVLKSNWFEIDSGDWCFNTLQGTGGVAFDLQVVAIGNYFSTSDSGVINQELIRGRHGVVLYNNIFHQRSGATFGNGTFGLNAGLEISDQLSTAVFNNIFISDKTSNQMTAIIPQGSTVSDQPRLAGYNCFWNTTAGNYILRTGDIEKNPQFIDIPTTLRLRPSSPCFGSGLPDLGGGGGAMGATQPAADANPDNRRNRYKLHDQYPND